MTKTLYTVIEIGYEYNDEIMYQPESGGGTPLVAYTTKERAQKEVDALNKKSIMDLINDSELNQYGYGWDDLDLDDVASLYRLPDLYDFTLSDFEKLSEIEQSRFLKEINLSFYEMYEVKVEDN